MLSLHATKAALVAIAAFALSASALPYTTRDAPSNAGCPSLGIGTLGFNATDVPIYNNKPPKMGVQVETYGAATGQLVATDPSSNSNAAPQQQFVFNNCSYSPAPFHGKGSVDSWQGYIQALNNQGSFQCLTVDSLETKDATISLKDCVLDASKPGGVDTSQHFQFQLNTFFNFYNVVFVGAGDGSLAEEQWTQGKDYQFNVTRTADYAPHKSLVVSYAPTESANPSRSEFLVAQMASIR